MNRSAWVSTAFIVAVLVVAAVRLVGLTVSSAEFYVDEAQYWVWAQTPSWGYFSKPPLIAWITAGAARLCGDGEACLRAPSTLAWAVTALIVFTIGGTLYGRRTALLAGLSALLAPGAAFSSRIVSTDAPLLTLWSAALLALVKLRAGGGWGWAIILGLSLGVGVLAKYAMLYAFGCVALAMVVDPPTRRALLSWKGLAAIVIAAAVAAPNLIWNLGHGLQTVRHTVGNAADDGISPGVVEPLVFLAAQFALAGPVVFAGWLAAVGRMGRASGPEPLLLAFSLPILAGMFGLAAVREVNANWAATGLIAVFVLGAATLARDMRGRRWLVGGLVFGLAIQGAVLVMDARADRLVIAGKAPYARTQGARALAHAVARKAEAEGAGTVAAETRSQTALLIYYARSRDITIKAWPPAAAGDPRDHFQMTRPLTGREAGAVIAVAPCPGAARFKGWGRVTDLGPVTVPVADGARTAWLFRLENPSAPPVRPAPCTHGE